MPSSRYSFPCPLFSMPSYISCHSSSFFSSYPSLMGTSSHLPPEFRAPPPSPVGGVRRSINGSGDEELDGFLDRSLTVPQLILPHHKLFPRQISSEAPPMIDFASLITSHGDEDHRAAVEAMRMAGGKMGCFQLVNHRITKEVIVAARAAAAGVFQMPPEQKVVMMRSGDRREGFEGEEVEEGGGEELFWWCNSDEKTAKIEMAGISDDFRFKMGVLWSDLEGVATKIVELLLLETKLLRKNTTTTPAACGGEAESVLCLHKSKKNRRDPMPMDNGDEHGDPSENIMHCDAIRMLIRSSFSSHYLGIHVVCGDGVLAGFRVYSKRGWISFQPNEDALVVTIGDQLQAWSGGLYRHVVGKPVSHKGVDGSDEESIISMGFLYSHPASSFSSTNITDDGAEEKTITLLQQLMIAAWLVILYHIIPYMCS